MLLELPWKFALGAGIREVDSVHYPTTAVSPCIGSTDLGIGIEHRDDELG